MYTYDELKEFADHCTRCELCKTRNHPVMGKGNLSSPVLFIAEAPGKNEDRDGMDNGTIGDNMKAIRVVAAIIIDGGKVFATQRGYGEFKDGWEFPGGKIDAGETPEEALVREIKEELDTEVEVKELLDTVEYDYPKFHLSMDCFICKIKAGELVLKEHEASKWLTKETLDSVEWLPADLGLIEKIENYLREG